MATQVPYNPTSAIAKALFNFDVFGEPNYTLSGTVLVSISDSFAPGENPDAYTFGPTEVDWTPEMIANIQDVLATFSSFANITFQWVGDFDASPPGTDDTPNPADVGQAHLADVNISWIDRPSEDYVGFAATMDADLGYTGAAGDIYLNQAFLDDLSLGLDSEGREVLMHELGHSLGMAHPHSTVNPVTGARKLTADFAATAKLGFDQLGFRTTSGASMDKEYFTIMTYDDQWDVAFTPMILDVIALQQAYGEGLGTHGAGDDTITAGNVGYRTYFDKGGNDTIDLSLYDEGAYLHMGATITGAAHLVGVLMSAQDGANLASGGDPISLRWFYGGFENALGSAVADRIVGNALNNTIDGGLGADTMSGGTGNDTYFVDNTGDLAQETGSLATEIDEVRSSVSYALGPNLERLTLTGSDNINGTGNSGNNVLTGNSGNNVLDGGAGVDTVVFSGVRADYAVLSGPGLLILTDNVGGGGSDSLARVERAQFTDGTDFYGTAAADKFLAGAAGKSFFFGLGGNDTYTIASGNNTIVGGDGANKVTTGAGDDTITTGAGKDTISAGAGDNTVNAGGGADKVTTGAGNDVLAGGDGKDTLTGGLGADIFRFDTAPNAATNLDKIADFLPGTDKFELENAIFTALAEADALPGGEFRGGAGIVSAADANDHLIYNSSSGALYYDADGLGGSAAIQIALLSKSLALGATDFEVT